MKQLPDESFEHWVKRVEMYEKGHAMKRIAAGEATDVVLAEMAQRIVNKLMHPVIKQLEHINYDFDADASRESYEENYLKRNDPKPDHILD